MLGVVEICRCFVLVCFGLVCCGSFDFGCNGLFLLFAVCLVCVCVCVPCFVWFVCSVLVCVFCLPFVFCLSFADLFARLVVGKLACLFARVCVRMCWFLVGCVWLCLFVILGLFV